MSASDQHGSLAPTLTFLTLPPEILHEVCERLRSPSLEVLRLTCRTLSTLVERHLFKLISVEARLDSIERLGILSLHPNLAKHVQRVLVDTATYPDLRRDAWNELTESYSPQEISQDHHPQFTRGRIAQYQTSLSAQDIDACYENFRFAVRQQELYCLELSMPTIFCMLRSFFQGLPHLKGIKCAGLWDSKYRVDKSGWGAQKELRRSQKDTLVIPNLSARRKHRIPNLAATAVLAALSAQPGISCVKLGGISIATIQALVEPSLLGLDQELSNLPALREFGAMVISHPRASDHDAMMRSVGALLAAAPNVDTITYHADHRRTLKGRFAPFDAGFVAYRNLKRLNLGYCRLGRVQLGYLFDMVRGALRSLHMGNLYLKDGKWPDLLQLMRTHLELTTLKIWGALYSDDGIWEAFEAPELNSPTQQSEQGTLAERVLSYVLHMTNERPLPSSASLHAQRLWEQASDHTMRYHSWVSWLELPNRPSFSVQYTPLEPSPREDGALSEGSGTDPAPEDPGTKSNGDGQLGGSEADTVGNDDAQGQDVFPERHPLLSQAVINDFTMEHAERQ